MKDFTIETLNVIKSNLAGLPSFCRLTIYELLEYCDYPSGIISINTLDEVAHKDFYIAASSGRKNERINADTLRNAFRTIKKAKPEQFKFTTKNQRIIIEMPFLRELYQQFHNETLQVSMEVTTDVAAVESHASIGEEAYFEEELAAEDARDVAAAPLRSIRDIKYNITNKLTAVGVNNSLNTKQPIQPNFYPNQETITTALSRGLLEVTNPEEIQKFVQYNLSNNSQWVDFNPIFLTWLERDNEYRQAKQQKQPSSAITRRSSNECLSPKNNSYESAMEAVLNCNRNACAPIEHYQSAPTHINRELGNNATHRVALDSNDEPLRPTLHHEAWDQRPWVVG